MQRGNVVLENRNINMLLQRVITAAILIPLFILFYKWSNFIWFTRGMALVTLCAAYEWAGLCGWVELNKKILYVFLVFLVMIFSLVLPIRWIMISGCVFWTLVFFYLCWIQAASPIQWSGWARALLGLFVLIPTWVSVSVANLAIGLFGLILFVVVAVADSAAYFAGKQWGKHLLASRISPKKTWEGLLGAALSLFVLAAIVAVWAEMTWFAFAKFLLLVEGLVCISVVGDLFESAIKRVAGVKDSGTLLKGHGGILDRIDGICASAPFFALFVSSYTW